MSGPLALLPSRRAVRRMDVLALVGAALSLALGVLAGVELARLAPLGTGLQQAASALESTGHALDAMSGVPIVGSQVSDLAGGIATTSAAVRAGAARGIERLNDRVMARVAFGETREVAFGGAQLVLRQGGHYVAGSDPRKDGGAVAF